MILYTRSHFFLAFLRLATISDHSLSMDVIFCTSRLNIATLVGGWTYARNAAFMTTWASSIFILWCFLSTPVYQRAVLRWWTCRSSYRKSMSKRGQSGWGIFPLAMMNTVSFTWRCVKCTLSTVWIAARP